MSFTVHTIVAPADAFYADAATIAVMRATRAARRAARTPIHGEDHPPTDARPVRLTREDGEPMPAGRALQPEALIPMNAEAVAKEMSA